MKPYVLLVSLLSLFTGCSSCKSSSDNATDADSTSVVRAFPTRPLVSVSYLQGSQMLPYPNIMFTVRQGAQGVEVVDYDIEANRNFLCTVEDNDLLLKMREVIEKFEMQNYKSSYVDADVLDGEGWQFCAQFADSTSTDADLAADCILSNGSNAGPKDDGFERLCNLYRQAMKHAVRLYPCDAEGNEIPDVSPEIMFGDNTLADQSLFVSINDSEYRGIIHYNDSYYSIQTQAQRAFGVRVLDDGKGPAIYLIVDNGAVECLPVANVIAGSYSTVRRSDADGFVDIRVVNQKVCGVTKDSAEVAVKWIDIEKTK